MRRLLAILLIAAGALSACGGSSSPNQPAGPLPASVPTEFCDAQRSNRALENVPSDPGQLRMLLSDAERNLDRSLASAPPDIRPDVELFVGAYRPFIRAVLAANLDFTKVSPALLGAIGDSRVLDAIARITAYSERVCK